MPVRSSAYFLARKMFQQRNSDAKVCMDEWGNREACWSPPAFTYADVDMPPGLSDQWPSDAEYA